MRWLTVLFLVMPMVELWLLLRLGDAFGGWVPILLVIATAILGAWLAKREGLRVLRDWQQALAEMRLPDEGITSGLLVLVGAVLLATPGVISDVVGLALLIPPIRKVVAAFVEKQAAARMASGRPGSAFDFRVVTPRGAYGRRRVVDVDGEVIEDREVRVEPPPVKHEQVDEVLEGEVVSAPKRLRS